MALNRTKWTFTSWETEDGEPPEFVKAGYTYEADYLAGLAAAAA
jgi:hypothetical protein